MKNKKMSKKEIMVFGKGFHEVINGMIKNGLKETHNIIEDKKTGKKFVVSFKEIED